MPRAWKKAPRCKFCGNIIKVTRFARCQRVHSQASTRATHLEISPSALLDSMSTTYSQLNSLLMSRLWMTSLQASKDSPFSQFPNPSLCRTVLRLRGQEPIVNLLSPTCRTSSIHGKKRASVQTVSNQVGPKSKKEFEIFPAKLLRPPLSCSPHISISNLHGRSAHVSVRRHSSFVASILAANAIL